MIRGTIKPIQSEELPLGVFLILFIATGNKITINITSANAEIICIQSIRNFSPHTKKKPRLYRYRGSNNYLIIQELINHRYS